MDLSHPPGQSVNDHVCKQLSSLHYISVDTAVDYILQLGPGALLSKVDVKHAYRNLPIHPDDRHLLGMAWGGGSLCGQDITVWASFCTEDFHGSGGHAWRGSG